MVKEVKIKVVGHRMIPFGELTNATGSANTPKLRLYFNSEWDGMSKTAKFTDARGNDAETTDIVDMTLQEDYSYLLEVPASVLQYEGDAQLTIVGTVVDGTSATTRITTIPLAFSVQDSGSWRVAWNNEQPEATVAEQVLAIVHDAEAYARGTVDGVDVPSGATGYLDNAKYYKEQAERYKNGTARDAAAAEAYAIGTVDGEPVPVDNSAKHWAEEAASYASAAEDAQTAAEGAAATAGNQAAAALGYRNEAQTFASSASGFAATAEAGKRAAETAQGLAETAQSKAEAAQSAAEGARVVASQAAIDADDARYDAVVAQGKAEDAQAAAETAQGLAEDAQAAAETAQGLVETAQTAAAASASDALASSQTAQAWAEGKRGDADVPSTDPAYHNNAKYWSEQAAQTLSSKYEKPANGIPTADIADGAVTIEKLADDVNERICSAYPSETQSGESILHTDIGADGVTVKALSATVRATGTGTLTAKNYGVNLLQRTNPVPSISVKRPNGTYEDKAGYRLYLPPGYYYLSIALARSGSIMNVVIVGADGTDKTLSNFYTASGNHPSTLDGAGGVVWYASTITDPSARKVKIDEGDALVLFMNNTLLGGQINWTYVDNLQVERGADVYPYPVTTPMQEYITPIAATIDYDGDGAFDTANLPASRYGINNWMFDLPLPSGVTSATLNVTYRCDPTLAYEKLKAAIVAAGTT